MIGRILGYGLAAFLAFIGVQKFIGDVPIFAIIEASVASRWGMDLPWIDPEFRYSTGVLELVAALLLILNQRLLGGLLSLAIIGGAIAAHVTVLGIETPMSSAPDAEKSPALFGMALVSFVVAALVTVLPRSNPVVTAE